MPSKKRKQSSKKISIIEGVKKLKHEDLIVKLTEQERIQFERARFAEEMTKKTSFVLGEPLHNR